MYNRPFFGYYRWHNSKPAKTAKKDTKLRALKPSGKVQKLLDCDGLYIHVSPAGGKLWRLFYRFDGNQKTLALGKYPEVSLAEARKRRDEARALNESCP
ncbi:Arm DNA-binding domain-containing protein [Bilophila wadsworthia]